jgi:hypothetical protein
MVDVVAVDGLDHYVATVLVEGLVATSSLNSSGWKRSAADLNEWVAFMNILKGKYCLQADQGLC